MADEMRIGKLIGVFAVMIIWIGVICMLIGAAYGRLGTDRRNGMLFLLAGLAMAVAGGLCIFWALFSVSRDIENIRKEGGRNEGM